MLKYKKVINMRILIILDVMLPKMNGFEILNKIRKEGIKSKVIMLTAKNLLQDKLNGFDNGANDYVTKPFYIDELVARVNVQLRNADLLDMAKSENKVKETYNNEDLSKLVERSILTFESINLLNNVES